MSASGRGLDGKCEGQQGSWVTRETSGPSLSTPDETQTGLTGGPTGWEVGERRSVWRTCVGGREGHTKEGVGEGTLET